MDFCGILGDKCAEGQIYILPILSGSRICPFFTLYLTTPTRQHPSNTTHFAPDISKPSFVTSLEAPGLSRPGRFTHFLLPHIHPNRAAFKVNHSTCFRDRDTAQKQIMSFLRGARAAQTIIQKVKNWPSQDCIKDILGCVYIRIFVERVSIHYNHFYHPFQKLH